MRPEKESAQLLGSCFKEKHMLAIGIMFYWYEDHKRELRHFFMSQDKSLLVYYDKIAGLIKSLGLEYDATEWRLFIDSTSRNLKVVLLHNGNCFPSIHIKYSVQMKDCPVGWGCRIHQLLLCRGLTPTSTSILDNAGAFENVKYPFIAPENTKNLLKLILADCKLKLHKISEELKISEGSVFTIFLEHLSMRKLCSKWVPCLLTINQKQQRVNDSEHCLQLFQCNKKEFLHKYVTMDETWIYHFTLESNRQLAE